MEIEGQLDGIGDRREDPPPGEKSNQKKRQKNEQGFDVRSHLHRMTGVDLTRIDGWTLAQR